MADAPLPLSPHGLHYSRHSGNFPVPLAAVALRHEVPGRKARQLLHAAEVLEDVGKCFAALPVHHLFDGDLFLCLIADGGGVVRGHVTARFILRRHLAGAAVHDLQDLLAVQLLTADNEP